METETKQKKFLTPARVKKLIVILILLTVVIIGFAHQRYLRSDSRIKAVWEDNQKVFVRTAEGITNYGKTFGKRSVSSCKDLIKGLDDTFGELSELGIIYLSYDGHDVDYYSEYDHYYIFHTDDDSVDKNYETELDDNWGYLKTTKK
ncbi:MAG: hypothetical protein IJ571_10680 [Ruminococcus sp.]|nr:hypothetical protein [Ruminococcus sp.]